MSKEINDALSRFVFWDEVYNDAESDFVTTSAHVTKCGYC